MISILDPIYFVLHGPCKKLIRQLQILLAQSAGAVE